MTDADDILASLPSELVTVAMGARPPLVDPGDVENGRAIWDMVHVEHLDFRTICRRMGWPQHDTWRIGEVLTRQKLIEDIRKQLKARAAGMYIAATETQAARVRVATTRNAISDEAKARIVAKILAGEKAHIVAEGAGVPRSTVASIMHRYRHEAALKAKEGGNG